MNGIIEKTDIVRNDQLLPLGLASEAVLLRDVTEGEAITYATVILNEHSHVLQLRRDQDQLMVSQS